MRYLRWLTSGESHGKGLLGIMDGLPAGVPISEDEIATDLRRRQQGHGRGKRMAIERDRAEIYGGVRHGLTLGSPVGLIIPNKDWVNWQSKMSSSPVDDPPPPVTLPRPGHADLAGVKKYGQTDIRNVLERSSARETAMRVALGALARKLLLELGITVGSRVTSIHEIVDTATPEMDPVKMNAVADASPVRCIDDDASSAMVAAITQAMEDGDSLGGTFEVVAAGLPYGLGSPMQWDLKLKARLSAAVMSINGIEGVEMGIGFAGTRREGSAFHDEIVPADDGEGVTRASNHAGGIEGGMSNAQPVVVRAAMKPLPTLRKPLRSVDIATGEPGLAHKERTDSCVVPAAAVIGESMVCLVIADALLEKFGGDSLDQVKAHMAASAQY